MNMMKPMVASPPPMGMGMGMASPPPRTMGAPLVPTGGLMSPSAASPPAAQQPKASANFDDLWSMSLGAGAAKPAAGGSRGGAPQKSMKDLEKEKAQASIWGGAGQGRPGMGSAAPPASSGNGLDDLLF